VTARRARRRSRTQIAQAPVCGQTLAPFFAPLGLPTAKHLRPRLSGFPFPSEDFPILRLPSTIRSAVEIHWLGKLAGQALPSAFHNKHVRIHTLHDSKRVQQRSTLQVSLKLLRRHQLKAFQFFPSNPPLCLLVRCHFDVAPAHRSFIRSIKTAGDFPGSFSRASQRNPLRLPQLGRKPSVKSYQQSGRRGDASSPPYWAPPKWLATSCRGLPNATPRRMFSSILSIASPGLAASRTE